MMSPDNLSRLLNEFIDQEMDVVLLFLKNVKELEIHEVAEDGTKRMLAQISISRSTLMEVGSESKFVKATVKTLRGTRETTKELYILHSTFSQDEVVHLLLKQTGYTRAALEGMLRVAKFLPEVGIAADPNVDPSRSALGKLFTYLPLPIATGFPVHIHGLFAIDSTRRYLKRPDEKGVQPGSHHQ